MNLLLALASLAIVLLILLLRRIREGWNDGLTGEIPWEDWPDPASAGGGRAEEIYGDRRVLERRQVRRISLLIAAAATLLGLVFFGLTEYPLRGTMVPVDRYTVVNLLCFLVTAVFGARSLDTARGPWRDMESK